ncbi:MAG TPA: FtsK/SpoIIIE domain-containing protein, partial [Pyrinomonadaceae bacterium]|nr:FtsK/SpoIIIE domain-containing protein [Pyrinomonadaceae bacterium]
VLSRYLIRRELGQERYFGWYFLDDYADWLGQKEEQIADILALSPETVEAGNRRLAVVISESKYVDYANLSVKRKESQKQLRQTIDRIAKALFGDPGRLDRDIWLSRFSDLVLTGIHFPANAQLDLSQWRRSIRDGKCDIYLRGYSHVFVSGPTDCPECSDFAQVAECDNTFQEVFSRAKLRELILHFWNETDPVEVRRANADEDVWTELTYRRPSDRITTLVQIAKRTPSKKGIEETDEAKREDAQQLPAASKGNDQSGASSVIKHRPEDEISPSNENKIDTPSLVSLLKQDTPSRAADTEEEKEWLKQVENQTKGALQQFQLQSKLVSSILTPNAALLKFQGSSNLTVEQVAKRRSEFLTTHGLNLISIRAEPGLVCLSVARLHRRLLGIAEAWSQWSPECANGNQELLIGVQEDDGSPLLYSPRKHAPHALIAGSTGSGKSVLMQNIILSIACTNTPDQAKIILIDPKLGVDYFAFEGLHHLQQGLITDQDGAALALNELVQEMNRRYQVLKENRVNNIFDLLKKADATEKPPILWVIHDEFAEWMLTQEYSEAVESVVGRLGVKARAAGIFLIFAAQRPDVSVMPMQLRANLGNRLVLRVDGEGTSEIALGVKGAERLLGKGHLAAKLEGEPDIIYAQVPFVESEFIDRIVTSVKASCSLP